MDFFNFGPSNSHIIEIAKRAKYTVLEVNDHMPIVNGLYDESIHISEVDAIVEYSSELSTISNPKPNKIDHQIASLILNEISNGATLQLGIGGYAECGWRIDCFIRFERHRDPS